MACAALRRRNVIAIIYPLASKARPRLARHGIADRTAISSLWGGTMSEPEQKISSKFLDAFSEIIGMTPDDPRFKSVAELIAEYQVKLTANKWQFEEYGVPLPRFDVGKEIRRRLLKGLKVAEDGHAHNLIKTFEDLESKIQGQSVISHNDTHTNNFLTAEHVSETGQVGDSYLNFGVIDWGDIGWNIPTGDPVDLWVHYQRVTDTMLHKPRLKFKHFLEAFANKYNQLGQKYGLSFDPREQMRAAVIKHTEWDAFEMYDPSRTDPEDIKNKAIRHYNAFQKDLQNLTTIGYPNQAAALKRHMDEIVKDIPYLMRVA